jgi:hypothetical protein
MPELEASIRDLISRYLAGDIDAGRLNHLLPDAWELDESGDEAATDLALLTIGYLAGYQSGDRSEPQLRDALAQLVTDKLVVEYPAGELVKRLMMVALASSQSAELIELSVEGDSSPAEGFESTSFQSPQTEHQTTTALLDPR